jgi:putative membrane protein
MKLHVALGIVVGLAVATALVVMNDGAAIFRALVGAGWGVLAVIAVHPWQTLFSGLAWRDLMPRQPAPGWLRFAVLRWIREAANGLLPVAQIGGELVGIRLLAMDGFALSDAGAGTAVDLTVETVTQLVFTLLGVGLLVFGPYDPVVTRWVGGATAVALLVIAAFLLAQLKGLFRPLERVLLWLAEKPRWAALGDFAGLQDAVVALYHQPRRLASAGFYHLISWMIGGIEVMVALHVVGVDIGLSQGLLIESIGQATRTVGFAIPGSLGIQEGGYVLACGLVGIAPQSAIELSLLKRIREVVIGIPGLVAWHFLEGRQLARRRAIAP